MKFLTIDMCSFSLARNLRVERVIDNSRSALFWRFMTLERNSDDRSNGTLGV
jgi:hypothetical protein